MGMNRLTSLRTQSRRLKLVFCGMMADRATWQGRDDMDWSSTELGGGEVGM